jgi:hypothetical protein
VDKESTLSGFVMGVEEEYTSPDMVRQKTLPLICGGRGNSPYFLKGEDTPLDLWSEKRYPPRLWRKKTLSHA